MKKLMIGMVLTAAVAALVSVNAMADDGMKVEAGGLTFEIPAEYKDLVTVETEGLNENTLISVSETASIEAAKALGEDREGAGWLFDISRVSEEELKQLRCELMEGMEVFAKCDEGEDYYLIYNHPTDVRFVREQYENIDEDEKEWQALNEWAFSDVKDSILRSNSILEPKTYGNTDLDMYLARAAFRNDTQFEIRSLDLGILDPKVLHEDDFIEELTDSDVSYEIVDEDVDLAGEYIALAFEEDGNKDAVRFDFFPQWPEHENYIREVRMIGDDEITTIYKATFKDNDFDDDDDVKTAGGIVRAWAEEIAQVK